MHNVVKRTAVAAGLIYIGCLTYLAIEWYIEVGQKALELREDGLQEPAATDVAEAVRKANE